jgi:hypothetical protein
MKEQDKEAFEKWFKPIQAQLTTDATPQKILSMSTWQAALVYERENNSPNEAYIKMLQDTVESQKKQIETLKLQHGFNLEGIARNFPESNASRKLMQLDFEQREQDYLTKQKTVVEYCYDHLDKMWAAKITGILLGCDFRDAKENADEFFKYCEEEGM